MPVRTVSFQMSKDLLCCCSADKFVWDILSCGCGSSLNNGQRKVEEFGAIAFGIEGDDSNAGALGILDDIQDLRASTMADDSNLFRPLHRIYGFDCADCTFIVDTHDEYPA